MISVARTAVAIDSWCDFGRHGARLDLVPSANAPRLSRAEAQSSLPTPGLHKTGKPRRWEYRGFSARAAS